MTSLDNFQVSVMLKTSKILYKETFNILRRMLSTLFLQVYLGKVMMI